MSSASSLDGTAQASATGLVCLHHHERAATGVCMGCKRPMCEECVTKIDGINQCRACLGKAASEGGRPGPVPARSGATHWAGVAVAFTLLFALMWLMLNVLFAGPQGST